MNKLPAKQIYLLAVIIIGIIALSVYSTYALFTFESSTSEIVSIHTPKSLKISENIYEYQQISVAENTITTTDIDIYNTFDYDVCYSIWYKVIENDIETNKVQVFEINSEKLTSSGTLNQSENIKITIGIINDNDKPVKINIGTVGAKKENDSCFLNLATDKSQINLAVKEIKVLQDEVMKNKKIIKEEKENYIIYENQTEKITYSETEKIYISNKIKYEKEMFTLESPLELTLGEFLEQTENQTIIDKENIYFCKSTNQCAILYRITDISNIEIEEQLNENTTESDEENITKYYHITKYDKLIGYQSGNNGLRKINKKDYVFYGDNPNNYIYYNCETDDKSSCELWRIIGFFYNEEKEDYHIKIVKNESIGKYQINSDYKNEEILWNNSNLYKQINEEYKIIHKYHNIEEPLQRIETLISLNDKFKVVIPEKINQDSDEETLPPLINILSLSDYIYSSVCEKDNLSEYQGDCLTNNWLNNIEIENEWTSTFKEKEIIEEQKETEKTEESEENEIEIENNLETEEIENEINSEDIEKVLEEEFINYAYTIGTTIEPLQIDTILDIRPVIYIKSRTLLIDGDGSYLKPYIIK